MREVEADSERRLKPLTRRQEAKPVTAGKGARRRSHRLECDIVFVLWRENLRVAIAGEQFHTDFASSACYGECCLLVRPGKTVVEAAFTEFGIESGKGRLLTGRDSTLSSRSLRIAGSSRCQLAREDPAKPKYG